MCLMILESMMEQEKYFEKNMETLKKRDEVLYKAICEYTPVEEKTGRKLRRSPRMGRSGF